MTKTRSSFRAKAAMLALAGFTTVALPMTPALADGWHGGDRHGWEHGGWERDRDWGRHHGGWDRGRDDDDDGAAIAVAAGVGLLLGAAVMSQPAYYAPPPVAYAPAPSGYYGQAPLQAVPTSDVYRSTSGQYCREYQSTIRVGGRLQQSYGTACLGEDGDWRVVQ
ncbi:hypothetical protein [Parvibaculum sp.]|uniref:hypothetical protein n=1 Tax=Parvibaculum sp. TaxID=2024848 RepID=UPI00320DD342